MYTRAQAPRFMREYLQRSSLDDGLPAPDFLLPPTAWGAVSSYVRHGTTVSETSLQSCIEGPSGLVTKSVFLEQHGETVITEFTSARGISVNYLLYYFEVVVHATDIQDVSVKLGITYQCVEDSAKPDADSQSTRLSRIMNTHCCQDGDTIGCGVCPKDGTIVFTKNGKYTGRRIADLRAATSFRPLLTITASNLSSPTRIRTRANFGQEPFAFDVCSWLQPLRQARMERFTQAAARLPSEVLTMIARFAAKELHDAEQAGLSGPEKSPALLRMHMVQRRRLAMVCRSWKKICLSAQFSTLVLLRDAHLRRASDMLENNIARGDSINTVYVGPDEASATQASAGFTPAMAVVLSSRAIRQCPSVRKIVWDELVPPCQVPPRVQAALSSLFRASVHGLTELRIRNRTLHSLDELLRVVYAVSTIRLLHLENLRCAPRAVAPARRPPPALSSLHELVIEGCVFSLEQVSMLLRTSLTGCAVAMQSGLKPKDAGEARIAIDSGDAEAVIGIAGALLASYYRPDVEHFCEDIALRAKLVNAEGAGSTYWDMSLLDRVPTSWPAPSARREVLRLSVGFACADDAPTTARRVALDVYNCYKPRPVTHWPAFERVLHTLDGPVSRLPRCEGVVFRMRDYPTWDEPWLPALANAAEELQDRVGSCMPRTKNMVCVEYAGVVERR